MGYVYIIIALIGFSLQFVLMQIFEKRVKQTMITGIVLAIGSCIVGALMFLAINGFRIEITTFSLIMAVAFAVDMFFYYILSLMTLSYGNLAIYSLFMMSGGMIIPFIYGIAFLDEEITVLKIVGIVLMTIFMITQSLPQKGQGIKSVKYIILCILIFIVNGFNSVIGKAHQVGENHVSEQSFVFLYCVMTAILCLLILLVASIKNRKTLKPQLKEVTRPKPLIIMTLLGIAMFGANFMLLLGARTVPASVQFPIISGGVIVLSAVASVVIFKAKLSKREIISVIGAFLSTILFAI